MSEKTEHNVIIEGIEDIKKILNGNGKIGLCAKVNLLWGGSVFVIGAVVVTLIKTFL